jgi:pyruvate kinase
MSGHVSRFRPILSHIYAFTPSLVIAGQMTLRWGVLPLLLPFTDKSDETLHDAEKLLRSRHLVKEGDPLITITVKEGGAQLYDSILLRNV